MTLLPQPDHPAGSRAIRQPGMAAATVAVCGCTAKNGKYCSLQIANYWHRFIIKGTYESRCKGRTACCVSARLDFPPADGGHCHGSHRSSRAAGMDPGLAATGLLRSGPDTDGARHGAFVSSVWSRCLLAHPDAVEPPHLSDQRGDGRLGNDGRAPVVHAGLPEHLFGG